MKTIHLVLWCYLFQFNFFLSLPKLKASFKENPIVFSSKVLGVYQIFTVEDNGENLIQLTHSEKDNIWPKWYPNGKRIVFVQKNRTGNHQIMSMKSDGSDLKNLSNNDENELDPVISPDGKSIAFINKKSGTYQMLVMNIDGSERKRITDDGDFSGRPDWSPDSQKLVYISNETGLFQVFRINADGSNKKQLTSLKNSAGSPSWSKNGYYILFHSHVNDVDQLFIMTPTGEGLKQISQGDLSTYSGRWTNNNEIIYTAEANGGSNIYSAKIDLKKGVFDTVKLIKNDNDYGMVDYLVRPFKIERPIRVSPKIDENYRLAYTSYSGGSADIFMMKPNGTEINRVTDTDDANSFPRDGGDGQSIIYRKAPSESGYVAKFIKRNLINGTESEYIENQFNQGATSTTVSPDERFITFVSKVNNVKELFLFDKKTQNEIKISNQEKGDLVMIENSYWSYDSKYVAFLSGSDFYNLFLKVYNTETGNLETVTPEGAMYSGVVWLKDNKSFIINIAIPNKVTYELFGINLDGSQYKKLTNNPGRGNLHPSISPDGNWIAFESGRDGDDGEIYIMKPDGSSQTRITYSRSYEGRPAWIDLNNLN